MTLPMPPAMPPSLRGKNPKIFAFADLLGYVLSMAYEDDPETACIIMGEIAAIHTHPQPKIGHRRCLVNVNGQEVMLTILASLPENQDLSPDFLHAAVTLADAAQDTAKSN